MGPEKRTPHFAPLLSHPAASAGPKHGDSKTRVLTQRDDFKFYHCTFIFDSSITNKMQRYTTVFITINALHVSGGSSAHHQELKTVYTA
jgi:hypothetical protein